MLTRDNNYPEHVPFYIILMKNSLANNANSYSRVTNVRIENVSYSFEEKKKILMKYFTSKKPFQRTLQSLSGWKIDTAFPTIHHDITAP